MDNAKLHKCGHVVRRVKRRGGIEEVTCDRIGAEPMFTRPMKGARTRSQPRWFCSIHWDKHEEMDFLGTITTPREYPGDYPHKVKLKAVS